MTNQDNLGRFIEAQEAVFNIALSEIKKGKKQGHWIWFIFPQIQGLGFSETSRFYAIQDINEAEEYLKHPILGNRLILICNELLALQSNDATKILGHPDDLKLKSCMTLFSSLDNADPVFKLVLEKFFNGNKDIKTLQKIGKK